MIGIIIGGVFIIMLIILVVIESVKEKRTKILKYREEELRRISRANRLERERLIEIERQNKEEEKLRAKLVRVQKVEERKNSDKAKYIENENLYRKEDEIHYFASNDISLDVSDINYVYSKPTKIAEEQKVQKMESFDVNNHIQGETQNIRKERNEIKAKTKEKLPNVVVETAKDKKEVTFVNYEVSQSEITNSYPIFRFPKKGTVVRTHRLGSTKRRGFKDELFQKSIEQYFGKYFTVLGNARLNTGKDTRPFEPDIAILDELSHTNLKIDIEIDEPYAGITRQAIHCKGDDINRDIYFVDRGWVVIRFSEYQVHLHENSCLRFIAEIIKSVIPQYNIPNELISQPLLQAESLWDIVQAQKWEKAKYREKYLNHIFLPVEERIETSDIAFDEQESKEEQLVKTTFAGKVENKKLIGHNDKNVHPRDSRITFFPDSHVYHIDNIPAPSASTIIDKFFPEFDMVYWANRKAPELGMSPYEVELMWRKKGDKAAQDGTFLHEEIEKFYLNQEYKRTKEIGLFEKFVSDNSTLTPYRTEWRVFDEDYHVAGTIDFISKNGDSYEMFDWKRSKKVVNPITGELIIKNQWQKGVGQFSDIDDTSYNRYCLQQSLYKYILEKKYRIKVSKMYLVVLYPDYDKYYKIEVPYLKEKIEYVLTTL